jgi:hypothetical protein
VGSKSSKEQGEKNSDYFVLLPRRHLRLKNGTLLVGPIRSDSRSCGDHRLSFSTASGGQKLAGRKTFTKENTQINPALFIFLANSF